MRAVTYLAILAGLVVGVWIGIHRDTIAEGNAAATTEYNKEVERYRHFYGDREWKQYSIKKGCDYHSAMIESGIYRETNPKNSLTYGTCLQIIVERNGKSNNELQPGDLVWMPVGKSRHK